MLPRLTIVFLLVQLMTRLVSAREPDRIIDLWPERAPGETIQDTGTALPRRDNENPPATRITGITQPRMMWYEPEVTVTNGAAVLIFPGGGYNYVVADKEGSEVADWLNGLGIAAGVVHYRTKRKPADDPMWERPVQDGQRAIRLVRQHAIEWGVNPDKIGVIGFSAGGNAAGLVATRFDSPAYESIDAADDLSCRPDRCLLLYPWKLADPDSGELSPEVTITNNTPTTFLAHAHDDPITVMSSIAFYSALKRHKIPAELHVYPNGGHGYGIRPVENSDVDTWPDRAADWLRLQGWAAGTD